MPELYGSEFDKVLLLAVKQAVGNYKDEETVLGFLREHIQRIGDDGLDAMYGPWYGFVQQDVKAEMERRKAAE